MKPLLTQRPYALSLALLVNLNLAEIVKRYPFASGSAIPAFVCPQHVKLGLRNQYVSAPLRSPECRTDPFKGVLLGMAQPKRARRRRVADWSTAGTSLLEASTDAREIESVPVQYPPLPVGGVTAFDRMVSLFTATNTKKLGVWVMFFLLVSRMKAFYGVMLGTFMLSYMGNTVVGWGMEKGNTALKKSSLPVKSLPRRLYAVAYMVLLMTALTLVSILTVPRLNVESQFLTALGEQDNPYTIITDWVRNNFGEEALSRLEPFLLSVTGDEGSTFAGYTVNYRDLIASKLKHSKAPWSPERYAKFSKLLQFCLSRYLRGGLEVCSRVVRGLTKVLYKAVVSLLFSFMVIWDLPNLARGLRALKNSRLGYAYRVVSPQVSTFAKLVGKSFEVQFSIAVINTLLTTAGLVALGVSGPLMISFIVFVCSFVPVVGVFLSTLPMAVAALSEYGVSKVMQVILMVLGVHAVEAYLLNPQIYSTHLKLHPVVVIGVLYVAEHLVGVQGLVVAVPCAVYVINNLILGGNKEEKNILLLDGEIERADSPGVSPAVAPSSSARGPATL